VHVQLHGPVGGLETLRADALRVVAEMKF
jgi:hypothetical protein